MGEDKDFLMYHSTLTEITTMKRYRDMEIYLYLYIYIDELTY